MPNSCFRSRQLLNEAPVWLFPGSPVASTLPPLPSGGLAPLVEKKGNPLKPSRKEEDTSCGGGFRWRRARPGAENEEHWPGRAHLEKVTACAGATGKRIRNRWGFPPAFAPFLREKVWRGGGRTPEHGLPSCSRGPPSRSVRFPGLVSAQGGLGASSTGLGREPRHPPLPLPTPPPPLPPRFSRLCLCKCSDSLTPELLGCPSALYLQWGVSWLCLKVGGVLLKVVGGG